MFGTSSTYRKDKYRNSNWIQYPVVRIRYYICLWADVYMGDEKINSLYFPHDTCVPMLNIRFQFKFDFYPASLWQTHCCNIIILNRQLPSVGCLYTTCNTRSLHKVRLSKQQWEREIERDGQSALRNALGQSKQHEPRGYIFRPDRIDFLCPCALALFPRIGYSRIAYNSRIVFFLRAYRAT